MWCDLRAGNLQQRNYRGLIRYLHDRDGERGREWFSVSVQANGDRLLRAHCEMDDEQLLRDVTYSLDVRWQPLEAFVRLVQQGITTGSAWFLFDDTGVDCEARTRSEGRIRQRRELGRRPLLFAPHPLQSDGWQAAAFDYSKGAGRQRLDPCANSSARPDGASGPLIGIVHKDLEYLGDERITVVAGTFTARHLKIHPLMPSMAHWTPLEFWVTGEDFQILRMRWDLLESTYELVQIDGDWR
jgi:hypothetical protein